MGVKNGQMLDVGGMSWSSFLTDSKCKVPSWESREGASLYGVWRGTKVDPLHMNSGHEQVVVLHKIKLLCQLVGPILPHDSKPTQCKVDEFGTGASFQHCSLRYDTLTMSYCPG